MVPSEFEHKHCLMNNNRSYLSLWALSSRPGMFLILLDRTGFSSTFNENLEESHLVDHPAHNAVDAFVRRHSLWVLPNNSEWLIVV